MDLGLSGAVSVVTGGASGIGKATAKLLTAEGAKVAVLDRSQAEGQATASELCTDGADAIAVTCDVTDEAGVAAAMATVAARWGVIDHLVCCAGISVLYGKTVEEVQVREWDDVMGVNEGSMAPDQARPALPTRLQKRLDHLRRIRLRLGRRSPRRCLLHLQGCRPHVCQGDVRRPTARRHPSELRVPQHRRHANVPPRTRSR